MDNFVAEETPSSLGLDINDRILHVAINSLRTKAYEYMNMISSSLHILISFPTACYPRCQRHGLLPARPGSYVLVSSRVPFLLFSENRETT